MDIFLEASDRSGLSVGDLMEIESIIVDRGNFSREKVQVGLYNFCCNVGMHRYYFKTTANNVIADHIESIMAAEIVSRNRGSSELDVDFVSEQENRAMYLINDDHEKAIEIEKRLETHFPDYRLQSYRTQGIHLKSHFRSYFVEKPLLEHTDITPQDEDINRVATRQFLDSTTQEARDRYQRVLKDSMNWNRPYIEVTDKVRDEIRIMISIPHSQSAHFLSGVSEIINYYGLVSKHKYAEPFANGRLVISIYLDADSTRPHIDDIVTDLSLIYINPRNELSPLISNNKLSVHEAFYAVSACKFTHQFLSSFSTEYLALSRAIQDRPELVDTLTRLRTHLVKDTYTEHRIQQTVHKYSSHIIELYEDFDHRFNPEGPSGKKLNAVDLGDVTSEIDQEILKFFLLFNRVVLKTNFYKKEKTSLSFRLDPQQFLDPVTYIDKPFAVFMVLGKEFRGFHVRFRDISRGGIRLVRSRDVENYDKNSDLIFDENYNLAYTQQKKNKDIPEGGSKGTILLNLYFQDMGDIAFEKYVDGLLDLMLPDESIRDHFGKEEILFLGPDEGTADLMSWASQQAKRRGYKFWQAISTAKPLSEGGIPHDIYGMTTNSVHEFVLGILEKLAIREEDITKVQTGGPDGDLGSNEILISRDKTICIIDGSGVLYDPRGINREEMTRLAKKRLMAEFFARNKLSKEGFFVHVNDNNVKLPDGTLVERGIEFRNTFHLHPMLKADLFVPCGGRPKSITIQNWKQLLDKDGSPRFKFIVEGANLFLTQPARLALEKRGVIIIKDASANKGGVTSSSLEVLGSLALADDEYDRFLCVKGEVVPQFREKYIKDVLDILRRNARLEFEVLWNESKSSKKPLSILTDELSGIINQLTDSIFASTLWENKNMVRLVLERYCPPTLTELVGIDEIINRLPDSYLQSLVSSWLASHFIYINGLQADMIDFHIFLKQFAC